MPLPSYCLFLVRRFGGTPVSDGGNHDGNIAGKEPFRLPTASPAFRFDINTYDARWGHQMDRTGDESNLGAHFRSRRRDSGLVVPMSGLAM